MQHHNSFSERANLLLKNKTYINNEKKIWNDAEKIIIPEGLGITSNTLCNKVTINLKKPLLICFESLDYIPYFPELAKPTRKIVEEILEINYKDISTKHYGGILDNDLKQIFQNKSKKNWLKIKQKFNVSFLIFPINWNIDLKFYTLGDKYKLYIID